MVGLIDWTVAIAMYVRLSSGYFAFFLAVCGAPFVTTDESDWGMFKKCYRQDVYNRLLKNNTEDKSDVPKCLFLTDLPAYHVAACCFVVLHYVSNFYWIFPVCKARDERNGTRRGTLMLLSLLSTLAAVIVVVLLGTQYKDDHRWKESNPSIGWLVWAYTSETIFEFIFYCFYWAWPVKQGAEPVRLTGFSFSSQDPVPQPCLSSDSSVPVDDRKRRTDTKYSGLGLFYSDPQSWIRNPKSFEDSTESSSYI